MKFSIKDFIITIDIDWAQDWVIDYTAKILIENNVKATWFVTHRSEAVDRLKRYSHLFELGIHPNMLSGSTHGNSEDEVLGHIKSIVPDAISMRTHGLYQSTNFLVKAAKGYGIAIDVSLFLPRATNLLPHRLNWGGSNLWRIPYFWEDDSEMFEDDPIWDLSNKRLEHYGLKVFDFHPIHIVLNTDKYEKYVNLQKIRPLSEWDEAFIQEHTNKGNGTGRFFLQLVEELRGKGACIKDIIGDKL
jgi:hypothetical protein